MEALLRVGVDEDGNLDSNIWEHGKSTKTEKRNIVIDSIFGEGREIDREETWRMASAVYKTEVRWFTEVQRLIDAGYLYEPKGQGGPLKKSPKAPNI